MPSVAELIRALQGERRDAGELTDHVRVGRPDDPPLADVGARGERLDVGAAVVRTRREHGRGRIGADLDAIRLGLTGVDQCQRRRQHVVDPGPDGGVRGRGDADQDIVRSLRDGGGLRCGRGADRPAR